MTKIKYLLACAALFIGVGLNSQAQTWSDGRVDAYTKQNPAHPMQVDSIQVTDLGNGYSLVDVVVEGIGWFSCFEVCQDSTVCCLSGDWTRSNGQPTEVLYLVPTNNLRYIFVNTANVHGWGGSAQ